MKKKALQSFYCFFTAGLLATFMVWVMLEYGAAAAADPCLWRKELTVVEPTELEPAVVTNEKTNLRDLVPTR